MSPARPVYTGPNTSAGLTIWGGSPDGGGLMGAGYSSERGSYPLAGAPSVADIERFPWLDPDDFDYDVVARVLRAPPAGKTRSVTSPCAVDREGATREQVARAPAFRLPFLCSLVDMFGIEETLVRLHTQPQVIEAAVAHLDAFLVGFIRRLLSATRGLLDVYNFGDDFATHRGMLLSPDHWRRLLKPTYERIFDLIKGHGIKVWFTVVARFGPFCRT